MLDFIRRNTEILILFTLWFLVGKSFPLVSYGLILFSILLLWKKDRFLDIFLGFIFITLLSDNLSYHTDFAKVFKNAYILILAGIPVVSRKKFQPYNRLYMLFVPFLLVALLVIFRSPIALVSFEKLVSYFLLLFAAPQYVNYAFKKQGAIAIKDLVYFAVFMVFTGLLMRFIVPEVATSHGGRFRAMFGNPNGLGIFLILLLNLFVVSHEYFKTLFGKNDLRFIALVIAVSVLFSGSRTAVLGAALFLFIIRFYKISPLFGFAVFFSMAFIGEFVAYNIVPILNALGLSEYFRVETLAEGSGRFIAWNFAWNYTQEAFWFGRGFAFDEWLMARYQNYLNDLGHQGGVHNTYLILWLNTGLVGLLLFLRAFFLLFYKASKNTPYAFPVMWFVMFSIMLEPWLAASLNPFTVMFISLVVIMTDELYQPYVRGELNTFDQINSQPQLA